MIVGERSATAHFITRNARILIPLEIIALAASLAWAYMLTGISISNSSGNVIRSSVLSPFPGIALVIFTGLLSITAAIHLESSGKGLRALSTLLAIILLASIPPVLYFNFIYSRNLVYSGVAYTTYPYAVQPAIPMMLSAFSLYMIFMVALVHGKIKKNEDLQRFYVEKSKD